MRCALALAIAASTLSAPAAADAGIDRARAILIAMEGDRCARDQRADSGDAAWALSWREPFQGADEPDRKARLLRVYCDSGAYNVLHAWFLETADGMAPLAFALPEYEVARRDEEFDAPVTGIKVKGFRSEYLLINSEFDPERQVIVMTSHWRGLGDAFSAGEWTLVAGVPVLRRFVVDAVYDGEQTPVAIYSAE